MRLSDRTLQDLVGLFKHLSDPSRLSVLIALTQHGELSVSALCGLLDQNRPAVGHHLAMLRLGSLIECRRERKHRKYRIRAAALADVVESGFALAARGPTLDCQEFSLTFKRTRAR
jgi:ArsR family transcriptional regulator